MNVNEAWYNNMRDFKHGVGKCAAIGALGAGAIYGCGGENNDECQVNNYATEEHYQEYCKENGLDPDEKSSLDMFNDWMEDVQKNESRHYSNKMLVRLTESDLHKIIKESVKGILKNYIK